MTVDPYTRFVGYYESTYGTYLYLLTEVVKPMNEPGMNTPVSFIQGPLWVCGCGLYI